MRYANIYGVKRTTVYLDETVDRELARLARLEGRSKAKLIREVLDDYVREQQEVATVPDWVGMASSGSGDLAERDEEILAELLEEEHERVMADYEQWQKDKQARGPHKEKVQR